MGRQKSHGGMILKTCAPISYKQKFIYQIMMLSAFDQLKNAQFASKHMNLENIFV